MTRPTTDYPHLYPHLRRVTEHVPEALKRKMQLSVQPIEAKR